MIGKAGLAMLALLAMGQSSPGGGEGAITLRVTHADDGRDGSLDFRITPEGKMDFDLRQPDPNDSKAPPQVEHFRRDGGFTSYRRVAALVAPLRRWKGSVPCDRPVRDPAAPPLWGAEDAILTIRWEADGATVKVPITCGFGPAENDIELGRAVFGQVREWGRASVGLTEDGLGNVTNVTVYDSNGQVVD